MMTFLISLHAIAGALALITGGWLVGVPRRPRAALFTTYFMALIVMFGVLIAVVAIDWASLQNGSRIVYTGLVALAGYMCLRALRAWRLLRSKLGPLSPRYVDDVGFTLISLFDGFVIVGAIDLNAPVPLTVGLGVFGVVAGIAIINLVKHRWYVRTS